MNEFLLSLIIGAQTGIFCPSVSFNILLPQQHNVTLAWNNKDCGHWNDYYITGIETSSNAINWTHLADLPYSTNCLVILSNRPSEEELYRIYNRVK